MKAVFAGRNDRLWLRKRVLQRAGMELSLQKKRRFGYQQIYIGIPDDYSIGQARRFVRLVRMRRRLYKLTHVADFLMKEFVFSLGLGFQRRQFSFKRRRRLRD